MLYVRTTRLRAMCVCLSLSNVSYLSNLCVSLSVLGKVCGAIVKQDLFGRRVQTNTCNYTHQPLADVASINTFAVNNTQNQFSVEFK